MSGAKKSLYRTLSHLQNLSLCGNLRVETLVETEETPALQCFSKLLARFAGVSNEWMCELIANENRGIS
jgi:hypothetical protein